MLYFILVIVLVILDQAVKFLIRSNIPLGGTAPFLPHILELTYVQNTGAAFSLFEEHTWMLAIISAAVSVVLLILLVRRVCPHPFGMLSLAVVLAGAVGNLIDRVFLGFVTDMFFVLLLQRSFSPPGCIHFFKICIYILGFLCNYIEPHILCHVIGSL